MNLTVTTLEQLKQYAQGQIVQLPSFGDDQPFVARLGRPSLMQLAKDGEIPNALLGTAGQLFTSGISSKKDENMLSEVYGVMESLCRATMLEPTYDDIIAAGLHLTDEQMLAIFEYTQKGVKALKSFREVPEHTDSAGDDAAV